MGLGWIIRRIEENGRWPALTAESYLSLQSQEVYEHPTFPKRRVFWFLADEEGLELADTAA